MKKSSLKIKDKLKNLINFKNPNPHIYWRFLLHLYFIVFIVLVIFSFYLLHEIRNQQIFQTKTTEKELPSLINEKLLNKVSEYFNNKSLKQKETIENPNTYKDPSLNFSLEI